jgi:hypothetical protein
MSSVTGGSRPRLPQSEGAKKNARIAASEQYSSPAWAAEPACEGVDNETHGEATEAAQGRVGRVSDRLAAPLSRSTPAEALPAPGMAAHRIPYPGSPPPSERRRWRVRGCATRGGHEPTHHRHRPHAGPHGRRALPRPEHRAVDRRRPRGLRLRRAPSVSAAVEPLSLAQAKRQRRRTGETGGRGRVQAPQTGGAYRRRPAGGIADTPAAVQTAPRASGVPGPMC